MKYLTKEELCNLTDTELDRYATIMTQYQMKILTIMDVWVDAYNDTSDEYDRRKPTSKRVIIKNESETRH